MELSVEFFPPKTAEGAAKLRSVREQLATALKPTFFSVTFGAGGSTQDGTLATVKEIHEAGQQAAPHLSCVGSSKEKIRELLAQYKALGINRIVALRGDLPSGMGQYGEFHHADELVSFIRHETDSHFHIEVAAYPEMHPQAKSMADDVLKFANKMKAGADSAITQYFFNSDAYFRFVDEAAKLGVDQPIVPGIMPITNSTQLLRFSVMVFVTSLKATSSGSFLSAGQGVLTNVPGRSGNFAVTGTEVAQPVKARTNITTMANIIKLLATP